jgi:hypothetical protein
MGVPTLEVGYTSATTGRGDHEVHKGHVALGKEKKNKFEKSGKFIVIGYDANGKIRLKTQYQECRDKGHNYCNMCSKVYSYLVEGTVINMGDTGTKAARCTNLVFAEEVLCTAVCNEQ